MGYQQRLYGILRFRCHSDSLGSLGLQDGFRDLYATLRRSTRPCCHNWTRTQTIISSFGGSYTEFSTQHNDIFPICLRSNHCGHHGWSLPWSDEFHSLDAFCTPLDHLLLYHWSLLTLGRWVLISKRRD